MDDRQEPKAGSDHSLRADILGHDVDYSTVKREFLRETSADTSESESHPRKKRKAQPEDFELRMQDGVAANEKPRCSSAVNFCHWEQFDSYKIASTIKLTRTEIIVLVCPEQDRTDDQEAENYYDGSCDITTPDVGQPYEEWIKETIIGNDSIVKRGILHFWRVEGKKDLAHFALRPLPYLDCGIGENPTLGDYEGPLLTLVEKRWPKNKGDKVMCVVEKRMLTMDELEEYMSTVTENPDRIATADGIYAIVDNGEGSHLAYHIASASRGKGSKSLSSLGVRVQGSFICWVKSPKASGTDIDKPLLYWKWVQEEFRGLLWTPLVQRHLVMEGTKILLIRGKSKNEKVKEDNLDGKLNDAEFSVDFEKELIELDYAGLDIVPLEDDHPIFELFEAVIDEFSIQWYPWE
ncbi:uncharacterized protein EAE97_005599 [Botrytis byssoidea]|uniref:Uncharacterized protein n=1 Tax=Botrytis byssoidea TaxID=139641 RepID=A0A9P5IS92_9HELO|nr:uncharacterized protein EAE97_005599 [Botrytis byssoidea]KAF7944966.1 hypothetical protein EAE97_005599 [Botrytis byssoidea]